MKGLIHVLAQADRENVGRVLLIFVYASQAAGKTASGEGTVQKISERTQVSASLILLIVFTWPNLDCSLPHSAIVPQRRFLELSSVCRALSRENS